MLANCIKSFSNAITGYHGPEFVEVRVGRPLLLKERICKIIITHLKDETIGKPITYVYEPLYFGATRPNVSFNGGKLQ